MSQPAPSAKKVLCQGSYSRLYLVTKRDPEYGLPLRALCPFCVKEFAINAATDALRAHSHVALTGSENVQPLRSSGGRRALG